MGAPGSYNNLGYTVANVFDDNLTTYFDGPNSSNGNGCWAQVFGTGNEQGHHPNQLLSAVRLSRRMVGGIFQRCKVAGFRRYSSAPPRWGRNPPPACSRLRTSNPRRFAMSAIFHPMTDGATWPSWSFMAICFPLPPLGPPTGLIASALSLSQSTSPGTLSLMRQPTTVKRTRSSGGPYTTVATGVTGTGFADTGLSSSTSYYVVGAANTGGVSGNWMQVSAITQGPPTITAPALGEPVNGRRKHYATGGPPAARGRSEPDLRLVDD